MRVADFFCGGGGFSEGFRQAGFQIVFAVDKWEPAVTTMSSDEFCQRLLKEEKVAIIPGNAFGESGEGFARISYAYSIKKLSAALDRIENFVNKL